MFHQLSIRNKLALVLWGAALLGFAVAGLALVLFESLTMESRARRIMEPYAQLVSVGAEAAVAFEDPVRAQEILDTLRANPQIMEAAIFLEDGRILAGYNHTPSTKPRPHSHQANGIYLSNDTAELMQHLQPGGYLSLTMSLDQLGHQTRRAFWVLGVGMLVLLAITFGQLAVLQKTIIRPIAALAEAAELVRTRGDYSLHLPSLPTNGNDEVARLSRSFQAMMSAVQERENDLRQITRFQRTILDNAAYGIISTTPDGIVSSFNPAAERLLGYKAAEVVAKLAAASWHDSEEMQRRASQLSRELGETITPDFAVFTACARRNLPDENEWSFIRKDGTRVPVLLSVTALRDEHSQITGFVGLVNDLTERKRAAKELHQAQQVFRSLIENSPDIIARYDRECRRTYVNPMYLKAAQIPPRDLLAVTPMQRSPLPAASAEILHNLLRKVLDSGVGEAADVAWPNADGADRWYNIYAFPETDFEGRVVSVMTVSRDITARKLAEKEIRKLNQGLDLRVRERTTQLEASNKELETFAYSVSHDLRAPLRSIDGFSQALLDDYAPKLDEEGKHYLRRVRAAAQRMGQLIDDMLNLSRVTRGEMAMGEVDLSSLAHEIADELTRREPERKVNFTIAPKTQAIGDARFLRGVLENLLGNAWKFTNKRKEAKIEFGLSQQDGARVFFVRDNGAGFDMQYANRLFGVFQRLHTTEEFSGTGIGLATVQRIIHRHGGRVWAEGETDRGATFYFSLPDREQQIRDR